MSGLANAIVLDPDPRAGRQLQLGFEREGVHKSAVVKRGELLDSVMYARVRSELPPTLPGEPATMAARDERD